MRAPLTAIARSVLRVTAHPVRLPDLARLLSLPAARLEVLLGTLEARDSLTHHDLTRGRVYLYTLGETRLEGVRVAR